MFKEGTYYTIIQLIISHSSSLSEFRAAWSVVAYPDTRTESRISRSGWHTDNKQIRETAGDSPRLWTPNTWFTPGHAVPVCRRDLETDQKDGHSWLELHGKNCPGRQGGWSTVTQDDSGTIYLQSSGAVWNPMWLSWAPVPNKPTVSVDVKQHSTNQRFTLV